MIGLFPTAAMVVISILYFNDIGAKTIGLFWLAFLAGFALIFVPFEGAGYLLLAYHAIVAAALFIKSKMSS